MQIASLPNNLVLFFLFLANAFFIYMFVDQSISFDHNSIALKWRIEQAKTLSSLLEIKLSGTSVKEFLDMLPSDLKKDVREKQDEIWVDNVRFEFTDDHLVRIAID